MTPQPTQAPGGLSDEEVALARSRFGDNALPRARGKSLFRRYLDNFRDPIIRVLLLALVLRICLSFGRVNWVETAGIALAVFLSTFVSTWSEYGSEKAFASLQNATASRTCRVWRNGVPTSVPVDEVVRGDLVILECGGTVPADGRLVSGRVTVDQSALNGESSEVPKAPAPGPFVPDPASPGCLFRGSLLESGEGVMEVTRTGGETLYGSIAREIQTETGESPLKGRLAVLARQISLIGYVAAALVSLGYLFSHFVVANRFVWADILRDLCDLSVLLPALLHALTLAITVVVVAVPEGLPMMITVVLSSNVKKMLRDHVLVKKMVGIETAGSMDLLLTDKTGTLTAGHMTVRHLVTATGEPLTSVTDLPPGSPLASLLASVAHYDTAARHRDGAVGGGNPTDRAVLSFFRNLPPPPARVLRHIPFDSRRRYEAAEIGEANATRILIKGAPEKLLAAATSALDRAGREIPMTGEVRRRVVRAWTEAAERGERVLCMCLSPAWPGEEGAFSGLTFLGLLCLSDRVRPDAARSVRRLREAGIQVVMVTGDHPATAAAVARECGILSSEGDGRVLTGAELGAMTDAEVAALLPRLRVVARALPADKSRLVRIAKAEDRVVGMTGDGVNDAPSLRWADVGFAMGQGTDVAREAADVVLTDGRLASVASTVLYGRTVFKSIRKFITFQLIMNLAAVGVSLVGQYVGIESPVTILQMLWVNVIMDTLGGLAFSGEPPLECYMKEKPLSRTEKILSPAMTHAVVCTGGYTLLLSSVFLASPCFRHKFGYAADPLPFLTAFFVLFIFCGIFCCFAVRTERLNPLQSLGRNPLFLCIMALVAVVQLCMVYFGGTLFRTVPLPAPLLAQTVGLAFSVVPFDVVRKCLYKLRRPRRAPAPGDRAPTSENTKSRAVSQN